jgi:hypothetical protein
MNRLTFIVLSTILILNFSCSENPKGLAKVDNSQENTILTSDSTFMHNIPIKELPYLDSTNFLNSHLGDSLTQDQIQMLSLNKIDSGDEINFWINYRLNISTGFNSIVVSYMPDENELCTVLINYTKLNKIIDFDTIAYDEIAESCINIQSRILKNSIEVKKTNYCSDDSDHPQVQTKLLMINTDGEIKANN